MKTKGLAMTLIVLISVYSCDSSKSEHRDVLDGTLVSNSTTSTNPSPSTTGAAKFNMTDCIDPDLSLVPSSVRLTMCDGTTKFGSFEPNPWHLRAGVTLAGVTGKLKVNCRSLADLSTIDNGDEGLDAHDTIDDWNENSANYPLDNPWNSDLHVCGGDSLASTTAEQNIVRHTLNQEDVLLDKISLLYISPVSTSEDDHQTAVNYCQNLDYGGYSDWRLPTMKELLHLTVNGLYDMISDPLWFGLTVSCQWTSTNFSADVNNAWAVCSDSGYTETISKTASNRQYFCIHSAPFNAVDL